MTLYSLQPSLDSDKDFGKVVETSVSITDNSPSQGYPLALKTDLLGSLWMNFFFPLLWSTTEYFYTSSALHNYSIIIIFIIFNERPDSIINWMKGVRF